MAVAITAATTDAAAAATAAAAAATTAAAAATTAAAGLGEVADTIASAAPATAEQTESKSFFACIQDTASSVVSAIKGFFNSILAFFGFGSKDVASTATDTASVELTPEAAAAPTSAALLELINAGAEDQAIRDAYNNAANDTIRATVDYQVWVASGSQENVGDSFGRETFLANPKADVVRTALTAIVNLSVTAA